MINIYM